VSFCTLIGDIKRELSDILIADDEDQITELLAIAYGILVLYLHTITGSNTLDGTIGVLLGVYICSHPAAHLLDLLYLAPGVRQQALSSQLGILWLGLNVVVLLVGVITIVIGANRFVQPP
jgi:hypothetical protein